MLIIVVFTKRKKNGYIVRRIYLSHYSYIDRTVPKMKETNISLWKIATPCARGIERFVYTIGTISSRVQSPRRPPLSVTIRTLGINADFDIKPSAFYRYIAPKYMYVTHNSRHCTAFPDDCIPVVTCVHILQSAQLCCTTNNDEL